MMSLSLTGEQLSLIVMACACCALAIGATIYKAGMVFGAKEQDKDWNERYTDLEYKLLSARPFELVGNHALSHPDHMVKFLRSSDKFNEAHCMDGCGFLAAGFPR